MIEQHDALRHPERIVIRDADHASAKPDITGALGSGRDHDFRRRGKLSACGVMLAKPRLVVAAAVEPLDKFEIALQRQRRIDTRLMEWCEKNTEAQSLAHGDGPPLDGGGFGLHA